MNIAVAIVLAATLLAVVAAGIDALGKGDRSADKVEPLISNADIFIAERTFLG